MSNCEGFIKINAIAVICCAAIISQVTNAEAHWQYTRWGMSRDEVMSASKGAAHAPLQPDRYYQDDFIHLLESTYKNNDLTFDVKFLFDHRKRLARVKLEPVDTKRCLSLEEHLSDAYGASYFRERTSTDMTIKWKDERN
jgi:hypothetical protein